MCGIAGIHFFNSKRRTMDNWELEVVVNDLLLGIEKRGRDATGVATIRGNGDIWIEKAELEASEFVKHRTGLTKRVKSVLLHTRYATQGHQSNNLNNHPVNFNNAVIVHNGHIRNDSEIFHDKGIERKAEVDSEAIAALFDKFGIEKAHLALQELEGGFAIAAIDQRKPTALVLGKGKSSPLAYYKNDNFIIWASEGAVLVDTLENTKPDLEVKFMDIDYLKDGDILYMDNGRLENLNFKVKEPRWVSVKPKTQQYTPNSYTQNWHSSYRPDPKMDEKDDDSVEEIKVPKSVIPRHGSYEIRVDGRKITYRCCFNCGVASNEDFLKRFDGGYWCEPCFEDEVEWVIPGKENTMETLAEAEKTKEMEAEDRILEHWERVEKGLLNEQVDHMVICEKIGDKMGLSKGMVDYLLFECEELMDGKIENEVVKGLYSTMADLYDIEVGKIVGDETEKAEVAEKEKGMEIVKFRGNEQKFVS